MAIAVRKKVTRKPAAKKVKAVAKRKPATKPALSVKNRVVVEIVTSHPISEKKATSAAALLLDRIDLQSKPIWASAPDVYAESLDVKQFSRVISKVKR